MPKSYRPTQSRPVPELLPERSDGVAHSFEFEEVPAGEYHGSLAMGKEVNLMATPWSNDDQAMLIKAHEQAHYMISPQSPQDLIRKHGVSMTSIQESENIRVVLKVQSAGIDTDCGYMPVEQMVEIAKSIDTIESAVRNACEVVGTGSFEPLIKNLKPEFRNKARDVARRGYSMLESAGHMREDGFPTIEDSIECARYFDAFFKKEKNEQEREEEKKKGGAGSGPKDERTKEEKKPGTAEVSDDDVEKSADELLEKHEDRFGTSDGMGRWGEMEVVKVPLPKHLPPKMMTSGRGPRNEGSIMKYMTRFATDGRVFATTTKVPGGTVLVDNSGSMSLSARQVLNILEAAVGATIALYEGNDTTGRLTIVAANGRYTDQGLKHIWGGNTVDGPALDWLALQKGPRIWVSDGLVVGSSSGADVLGRNLYAYCADMQRKHRIVRVENPEAAVEMINKVYGRRQR